MLKRRRSKGQALVEFALMATLIFFLLAATVDLGLIFFTLQGLHNAAQEGGTYGSRWLATGPNGMQVLDYAGIRDRARNEAGDRGSGFANLLDLNANGQDDDQEDNAHKGDANTGDGTNLTVFPQYIQIRALLDENQNGDPTDDGSWPDYKPCPNVANQAIDCFLKVDVSSEYKVLFPFAPFLGRQRKLTSSYVIRMRPGISQGGPTSP